MKKTNGCYNLNLAKLSPNLFQLLLQVFRIYVYISYFDGLYHWIMDYLVKLSSLNWSYLDSWWFWFWDFPHFQVIFICGCVHLCRCPYFWCFTCDVLIILIIILWLCILVVSFVDCFIFFDFYGGIHYLSWTYFILKGKQLNKIIKTVVSPRILFQTFVL